MLTGESIAAALYEDEEVELQRDPHPIGYVEHYIGGVLLTVGSLATLFLIRDMSALTQFMPQRWIYAGFGVFAAFGVLYIIGAEMHRRARDYYVTNQRVIKSYDLFAKKLESAPYNRVQDVTLHQSFTERLFAVGDVGVNTAGSEAKEIVLQGVEDPETVKQMIMQHLAQSRGRGGI